MTETAAGLLERVNSSTGACLGRAPIAGEVEVDAAVEAAWEAFPAWKGLRADRRRDLLNAMAATVLAHELELQQINAVETGTPLSSVSLLQGVDHLKYYAGWCDEFGGELIASYPA